MTKQLGLIIILCISIAGMLFSGYLSFGELFKGSCPVGGGCSSIAGLPTCVYGFIMYLIVFVVSVWALYSKV